MEKYYIHMILYHTIIIYIILAHKTFSRFCKPRKKLEFYFEKQIYIQIHN